MITAKVGVNRDLNWTLDPMPPPSEIVNVLHPSGQIMFSALGDMVVLASMFFSRIHNTDNTNTSSGNIEFTLNGIKTEDAGNYTARYTQADMVVGWRKIYVVGVTLIVYDLPSRPIIEEVSPPFQGSTMLLNCLTTSNTKPDNHGFKMTYTWYRNGEALPTDDRYVTSKSQLQVKNIAHSDNKTVYSCTAFEIVSLISDLSDQYTVNLQRYGPETVLPNATKHYSLGESTQLIGPIKCYANCKPRCAYQWKLNGNNVGSPGDTLSINPIKRSSAGTYWCEASNVYGTERSSNVTIVVLYSPDVPNLRTNVAENTVFENTSVTLTCSSDGFPLPNITIISLDKDGKRHTTQRSRTGTLTIEAKHCLDTIRYICEAKNEIDISTSKEINMNVTCSPRIDIGSEETPTIFLDIGDTLNITTRVVSNPTAAIQWAFGKRGDTRKLYLTNNTDDFYSNNAGKDLQQSSAIRKNMELEYFGKYTLIASNTYGILIIPYNVLPKQKFQPPHQLRAACGNKMAELLLLIINELNESLKIHVSTDRQVFNEFKTVFDYTRTPVIVANVFGLEARTQYFFKVISTSRFGVTESTNFENCTTTDSIRENQDGRTMFDGGIAMLVIGLVLIAITASVTGILYRRYNPCQYFKDSKLDRSSKTSEVYEDIGSNSATHTQTEQEKDYSEVEVDSKSSVYQDLGQRNLPSVYEELRLREIQDKQL